MLQMGSVGPMLGQAHHFHALPQGQVRSTRSGVIGRRRSESTACSTQRLGECEYLAGEYSIADIATWPWISRYEWQGIDWRAYPQLKALVSDDRAAAGRAARL